MTEVETTRETHGFRCRRCGHSRERAYQVLGGHDRCGAEFARYRIDGLQDRSSPRGYW